MPGLPDADPGSALLEVTVLGERDVAAALEGGADRLQLVTPGPDGGVSPEPAEVTAVVRASEVPVRVVLRLGEGYTVTGGEMSRLVGLAHDYLDRGAEGLVLGFLDRDLEIDRQACQTLLERTPTSVWTFGRAIDHALDSRRAWRDVLSLPGLHAVRSGGSPQGLEVGFDDLLERAQGDPDVARVVMPGGGLAAEQVPWFARAGVRQFHVGPQVRPTGSYKRANVDAALTRSWRLLVDDAVARAVASG